jgi:hypothetical protein
MPAIVTLRTLSEPGSRSKAVAGICQELLIKDEEELSSASFANLADLWHGLVVIAIHERRGATDE